MYKIILFGALLQCTWAFTFEVPRLQVLSSFFGDNDSDPNKCGQHINELFSAIGRMESWALQMLDSFSKIPSGILTGNIRDLGNFDECLAVEHNSSMGFIQGKHCIASVDLAAFGKIISAGGLSMVPTQWSACVPDSCMASDLNNIISRLDEKINLKIPLTFNDVSCRSKSTQPELNGGDIATITLFAVLCAIAVCSTIYDSVLYYTKKKPAHIALIAFSVLSNGKKLIAVSPSSGQLQCLNGIRTISIMWVVIGHIYAGVLFNSSMNIVDIYNFGMIPDSMFVLGATVAVDTFFLVGGLVLAYVFLNSVDKGEKFNLPMFYIHRYLRLTPAFAAVILLQVTLIRFFAFGPWDDLNKQTVEYCKDTWWSALLYVQNYVSPMTYCINSSWYLAVDMQLYVLSPLILIPLSRWPKRTINAILFLCFCVTCGVFITAWHFKLVPFMGIGVTAEQNKAYVTYYYAQTHTRATPWLIGIILGYYVYYFKKHKESLKINKIIVGVLWLASLTVLATCVFCGHNLITDEYILWINSTYITLIRPAWSIALSWLIFACIFGYGSPINWFLSLPVFQVMSRFTYSIYILHITLMLGVVGSMRAPKYFSNFNVFMDFWGFFMLSFGVAFIWTLLFESPIIVLEKVIFSRGNPAKDNSVIIAKNISDGIIPIDQIGEGYKEDAKTDGDFQEENVGIDSEKKKALPFP